MLTPLRAVAEFRGFVVTPPPPPFFKLCILVNTHTRSEIRSESKLEEIVRERPRFHIVSSEFGNRISVNIG